MEITIAGGYWIQQSVQIWPSLEAQVYGSYDLKFFLILGIL